MSDQSNAGADGAITAENIEAMAAQQAAVEAQRDAARVTDYLASVGLSQEDPVGREVEEFVSGKKKVSQELHNAVQAKVAGWAHDKEFQRKLMNGDQEARRLLDISSAMLMAGIEDKGAS